MVTLEYSFITSFMEGVKGHPQQILKDLGYNVLDYAANPLADFALLEVEKIIGPLPKFLKITEANLSQWRNTVGGL